MIFFLWCCDPTRVMVSSFTRFLDHTQRRTTVGRTPLDEWSARRRDLYLTTHNSHNRQTSMPPGGIRTHDLSMRVAAGLRLRPRSQWDWHVWWLLPPKKNGKGKNVRLGSAINRRGYTVCSCAANKTSPMQSCRRSLISCTYDTSMSAAPAPLPSLMARCV